MEMSDDDAEDADDAWMHAPIARLFPTALEARTGAETLDSDDDATTGPGPVEWTREGWGAFGTRAARTPGDRVRARFRDAALANAEAFRALSPEARAEATERAEKDTAPGFLPGVPAYGGVPFSRVPTWTHPHWPLGGMGDAPAGRLKGAARKLPRVWRGKDLDMIVFGRDERLEWARKTGMFLARARTALGDRRLHRDAWGGSVLDSVMGAMLTQNVSDVLVELRHHEPRREIPGPRRPEPGRGERRGARGESRARRRARQRRRGRGRGRGRGPARRRRERSRRR